MTRQWILLFVSLAALTGAVVAAFASTHAQQNDLRGYIDPTTTSHLPFRIPRPGVNADLTQYTPAELTQQLDMMVSANLYWVRQEFRWAEIEPQQGVFNWTQWDAIVESVHQNDKLQLVAVLNTSPPWTHNTTSTTSSTASPHDPTLFADFAGRFAARYGHQINYFQIWDEPNLAVGWGEQNPNPTEYAALLAAAYTAIHENDPDATVIAAGLAPTTASTPLTIPDTTFLRALYQVGAGNYMDAIAAKPYGFDSPPESPVHPDVLNFRRSVLLREIMVEYGDANKALWATQWGWNSLPENWTGAPSVWGSVSPDQQIRYTLAAFDLAERQWPWLGGLILAAWQPAIPPDNPFQGFALLTPDNEATPLYEALTNRINITTATNGLFPAQNPHTSYSGIWTFGELGADIGWINDSRVEFTFTGQDISLLLRQADYVAYLYAEINQQPANALPQDINGNAYLMLTSGDLTPSIELVPVARNLESTSHRLTLVTDELIPDEPENRWSLVGFAVSDGNLSVAYERQIAAAWFAVFVAAMTTIISAAHITWQPVQRRISGILTALTAAGRLFIGLISSMALMIGVLFTWGDSVPDLLRRDTVNIAVSLLTAGLIYIQPGLLLTLAAAVLLFAIIYHQITIGLFLILFWSPFFLFPVELYLFAFPTAEIILWITVAAWGLQQLQALHPTRKTGLRNQTSFYVTWLDIGIIAYVILGILSLLWTQRLDPAFTELRTIIIQPALFYLVIRTSISEQREIMWLVNGLIVAGVTVALIGLVQFLRGEAIITAEDGARRLASVYGSPNNVALLMGRTLPFALVLLFISAKQRSRIIYGAAALILGTATILTQSVGAILIGIPASIATLLLLTFRRRAVIPIVGLVLAGIVLFLVAYQVSPRFTRVLDMTQGTNFYRLRVWESAINMIADHPITGIGLDQFLYEFRGTYILPDAWEEPNLSHPHNLILDVWLRLGIAGLFVVLALITLFWRNILRTLHQIDRYRQPLLAAILIGASGSMVNLIAHGLVDNSIFVLDLAYIFMLLIALGNLKNTSAIDSQN